MEKHLAPILADVLIKTYNQFFWMKKFCVCENICQKFNFNLSLNLILLGSRQAAISSSLLTQSSWLPQVAECLQNICLRIGPYQGSFGCSFCRHVAASATAAIGSGTVRFELTTFFGSARFQDECHKPDSTKYPFWQVQNFCPHGSFCPAAVSRCHVGAARYQEELNL